MCFESVDKILNDSGWDQKIIQIGEIRSGPQHLSEYHLLFYRILGFLECIIRKRYILPALYSY